MLWIIAFLLAAILVTLLGAWKSVGNAIPKVILGILAFILWIVLVYATSEWFGDIGAKIAIASPFVILFALCIYGGVMDHRDKRKRKRTPWRERQRVMRPKRLP